MRWDKFEAAQNFRATSSAAAYTANNDSDFFTYQSGITFKPVENGSIYASYATSASPVGLNAGWGDNSETINANNQMIDPEEAQTYELGTKWDLLNDRLNLTAAIFRTEKQNTRVQLDPTTYANVGESKVDGVELGLNGQITDKWDISAGYTYLNSELTKMVNHAVVQVQQQLVQIMPFIMATKCLMYLNKQQHYGLPIRYCRN